jgi:hypothetical protein
VADTLWYVNAEQMGQDPDIGSRLIHMYFNSLGERMTEPGTFAFMNRGIFLTQAGSPVIGALRGLEARGSRFLSCGTCLDFYGVRDSLGVGEVGSMSLLQELMLSAAKVITL